MTWLELLQQDPAAFVLTLILSLIITLVAYGAFPLIFAMVRNEIITKKKYNILCFAINFVVMVVFIAINGEPSSGGPYLLWTWVFSTLGIKILKSRGVLEEFSHTVTTDDEVEKSPFKTVLNETKGTNDYHSSETTSFANQNKVEEKIKHSKKIAKIVTPIVIVFVVFVILYSVIIPNSKYNHAVALMEDGEYTKAYECFEKMGNYKDSFQKRSELKSILLSQTEKLYLSGNASEAAVLATVIDLPIANAYQCVASGNYKEAVSLGLTDIVIPDGVTCIDNRAFYGCSGLTSITIPYGVTSIGSEAFLGCKSLISIAIPNSVMSIGEGAFYGCSGLTSITLPFVGASKDGTTNTFLGYIFGYIVEESSLNFLCNELYVPSSLKTVVITGDTSIGEDAFNGCSGLTSITIPNSVTSIERGAFIGCKSLTSITIPNKVKSIGVGAFNNCSNLTNITIPNSVTSIGSGAFNNCSNLTNITIPNSVTSIGSGAFIGCKCLTSITIPIGVTSIGDYTFFNCKSLASITIPISVTSIGENAFSSCENLISITIPNSVTSIGDYAFDACTSLAKISFAGTKVQWKVISKGHYWNSRTGEYTVYCMDGNISK